MFMEQPHDVSLSSSTTTEGGSTPATIGSSTTSNSLAADQLELDESSQGAQNITNETTLSTQQTKHHIS